MAGNRYLNCTVQWVELARFYPQYWLHGCAAFLLLKDSPNLAEIIPSDTRYQLNHSTVSEFLNGIFNEFREVMDGCGAVSTECLWLLSRRKKKSPSH